MSEASSTQIRTHLNFALQVAFLALMAGLAGAYFTGQDSPQPPLGDLSKTENSMRDAKQAYIKARQSADDLLKKAQQLDASIDPRSKADAKIVYQTATAADDDARKLGEQAQQSNDAFAAAKAAQDQYLKDEHHYLMIRLTGILVLPAVISAFFLVVYYGTSFQVTPFGMVMPWWFKRKAPITPLVEPENPFSPEEIFRESLKNTAKLAARMERRTNTHLILGVTMGLLGVSVWLVVQTMSSNRTSYEQYRYQEERETRAKALADQEHRLREQDEMDDLLIHDYGTRAEKLRQYELGNELRDLTVQMKALQATASTPPMNLGTVLSEDMISLLPRLTILIFIEVLAGFFLRQYRIGVEDLKYFIELERKAQARSISFSIYNQLDAAAKTKFAETIMTETSQFILKEGETTATAKAMQVEKNEITQILELFGKQLASLTELIKK